MQSDLMVVVAIEAQEREVEAQFQGAKDLLSARKEALAVMEEQAESEFESVCEALRKRKTQLQGAKKALGLGVRSTSGLL